MSENAVVHQIKFCYKLWIIFIIDRSYREHYNAIPPNRSI